MERIIDIFRKRVLELNAAGVRQAEIARKLGLSHANLWRKLNLAKTLDADVWQKFKALYGDCGS